MLLYLLPLCRGFPGGSVSKESACIAGDPDSIPGMGKYPRGGNGNLLQYSCLENPMDREVWQATVHGVARVGYNLMTNPQPHNVHSIHILTPLILE